MILPVIWLDTVQLKQVVQSHPFHSRPGSFEVVRVQVHLRFQDTHGPVESMEIQIPTPPPRDAFRAPMPTFLSRKLRSTQTSFPRTKVRPWRCIAPTAGGVPPRPRSWWNLVTRMCCISMVGSTPGRRPVLQWSEFHE